MIVITSQVSFRPQQGLPIMNMMLHLTTTMYNTQSFRPQQGLPIMNGKIKMEKIINFGFRPQQGLPIMNLEKVNNEYKGYTLFPSPTGVTYYEYLERKK